MFFACLWASMLQICSRKNCEISSLVELVCRFAYKLVAAGKRHLPDFCNCFVGIYSQTFSVFGCLPYHRFCIRFRFACRRCYFPRTRACNTLGGRFCNYDWHLSDCKISWKIEVENYKLKS